jgi:uncharacterized protein YndB with AHSA1/START domain
MTISNDRVEKQIELKAPVSRVWRALTDSNEFGEWFCVKLDSPFVAGQPSSGNITWPGYEHLKFDAVIQRIDPETFFSFTWHPYPIDPAVDYSTEPSTLVEFRLEPTAAGTLLQVVESGFEKLPAERRDLVFRMNEGGWVQQMSNIALYVAEHP